MPQFERTVVNQVDLVNTESLLGVSGLIKMGIIKNVTFGEDSQSSGVQLYPHFQVVGNMFWLSWANRQPKFLELVIYVLMDRGVGDTIFDSYNNSKQTRKFSLNLV